MTATFSRLSAKLLPWWQQRAPRERAMLTLMCAAVVAFALWYGAFVPLRLARDAEQARHARAATELAQVTAELAGVAELEERLPSPAAGAEALEQAVLDSAKQAGLEIGRGREDGAGGFEIESDAASPAQLFAWLDELRQRHGLAPATLSVARNQDRLRVQASFQSPSQ